MKRRASVLTLSLLVLSSIAVVAVTSGCSGGSALQSSPVTTAHATGGLIMHIAWPVVTSRLIPDATHTIQIAISYPAGGSAAPTTTIPHGQTTATIGGLPVGSLMLTASALDANGAVTASGTKSFTVVANQNVPVSVDMTSTIDHLVISPADPIVTVGDSTPLLVSGVNTSGAMVLLTPSKLTWQMATTADAAYASVDSSGDVTGIAPGTANVEVTDTESGKSATVAVTVQTSAQAQDEAICLANEQKISQAIAQYVSDNDGSMPDCDSGYGGGGGWAGQVYPYLTPQTTTIFVCPLDTGNGTQAGGPWRASSYGYNSNFTLPNPAIQDCSIQGNSYPLSACTAPAKTVVLFEVTNSGYYNVDTEANRSLPGSPAVNCGGSPVGNGLGGAYDPFGYNSTATPTAPNDGYLKYATGILNNETNPTGLLTFASPTGRHQGGANYLMADGHAAFLQPSTVSPGGNAASATSNQVDFGPSSSQFYNPAAGTSGHFSDGVTVPAATFSIF
jgi:prepilin-type processing-associated H-X9-DG protein